MRFSIIAPGTIGNYQAIAATARVGEKELSPSFVYALENGITRRNPFDPARRMSLRMHQFELGWPLAF